MLRQQGIFGLGLMLAVSVAQACRSDDNTRRAYAGDAGTGGEALVAVIDFTCALVADGGVQCWGEGDLGQLGDGNENDSYVSDGRYGQLGDGAFRIDQAFGVIMPVTALDL